MVTVNALGPGEVGYVVAGISDVGGARSGETITEAARPAASRSRATSTPSRWSFAGSTRSTATTCANLRDALDKLKLNDASITYEPESLPRAGLRIPLRIPRASCTWRSCASAWSASSTSASSRRRRRSSTARSSPTARRLLVDNPTDLPDLESTRSRRRADARRHDPHAGGVPRAR